MTRATQDRFLPTALQAQPWRQHVANSSAAPPTMLMPPELNLLHWLTSSYYRGEGAIVDGGCFLGGSTYALADGLSTNTTARNAASQTLGKPIHSYDLFVAPQATWYEELRRFDVEPEVPFLARFRQHLTPHLDRLEIHAGDLLAQSWSGQPVEILFLDICKSPALHDHATRLWFPRLIPGRSIVVQQDYGWRHYPWGNVMMEAFADHFTVLDDLPVASRAYLCTKGITQRQADELTYARMSADDKLRHMDAALRSVQKSPFRGQVMLNYALLADSLGRRELVEDMLVRVMYMERCDKAAPIAVQLLPHYFSGPAKLGMPPDMNNLQLALISQMSMFERLCLYSLVTGLRPNRVLEIGRARGGSTLIIAAALEHVPGSRFVSLDPNCHPEHKISPALVQRLQTQVQFIDGHSPRDNSQACAAVQGKFDLVVIDADHHYEACLADLEGIVPFLNDGAVLLLHDAHFLGVKEAIRTTLEGDPGLIDCGLVSTGANYDLTDRQYLGQPSVFGGLHMLRFDSSRRPRFWRLDLSPKAKLPAAGRQKLPFISRVKREVKRVLGRKVA